jgi:hypothetical protein
MITATATDFKLLPAEVHNGPFDVWNPGAAEGKQHHRFVTLIAARAIAKCESANEGRVQVFDAEHHLIAWAKDGRWHGPEVA